MKELAGRILQEAVNQGATDLYVLPAGDRYRLLFRTSSGRSEVGKLDGGQALSLIAHFKFCAGMAVGEKRRSQLGACLYAIGEGARRLRLSSVGDFEGRESLVIRLLHDKSAVLEFWLGSAQEAQGLVRGRGLYLFSGPVGSGKTTLMYHLAREKFAGRQVITIEDPVEIVEPDFLQLQRNDLIGATYDDLIKLSLRHMPDLVIVGEIRDEATARAVIRASLTGYTVFSTVHAKSIAGVYARLLELGLTRGELNNALAGVVYQRLIAGKGLIDVRKEEFENAEASSWNRKITSLVAAGHLDPAQAKAEKIRAGKANQADSAHE